jgi:hypothetical protein
LSTAAALGSKPCAVELEARQLQHPDLGHSSRGPSSICARRSSIVGMMLPATATRRPVRSTSRPVIAVVVVLPLVPVMAMTCGA